MLFLCEWRSYCKSQDELARKDLFREGGKKQSTISGCTYTAFREEKQN
jgi:hypothetical protein